ncbi:ABC transporter permease [Mumia sp. ZJ1417]|uniref:ABC transporter permease n=1 Tax=Mumia sp. ZJ1417 TaxID=2708082 RepID=UPI001422633B|nr:ABC transporter permease [Mumia sp. ZJ1417]QMW64851.1 ABC transporter permease [Mumia sp. ZJ1417]
MDLVRYGVVLVLLTAVTLVVMTWAGVRLRTDAVVATVRGLVQLSLISLVIAWAFRHPTAAAALLVVMLAAAALTSTRRIGLGYGVYPTALGAIACGATVTVAPVMALDILPGGAEMVVPFAAQVIGGAMVAASLSGQRLRDDVTDRWGEVEAGLAIGLTPRQSVSEFGPRAVARALTPGLDQTRAAGLVTLPGAYVGLLLGGATPYEAALVQTLVLVGLLAAQSISAATTVLGLSGRLGERRPEVATA